jgi:alkylhydroperoxidase family enzyme
MLLDPAGAGSDPDAETVPERSTQLAHWPTSPAFTEGERAHLALAEQLVIDGSGVDDALVGALAAHHSAREIYTFVRWVQASEARARARLVLRHHSESGRFR